MKRSSTIFCLVFFGLLIMAAGRAGATTLLPKDFQDLVREADIVFVGTVTDMYSEWLDERQNVIYTYVTFNDLEIIAGDYQESSIEVRHIGGEVDGFWFEAVGAPCFKLGQRSLVFLTGNDIEMCPIVGWWQGRFKVIIDEDTGDEVLFSNDGRLVQEIRDNKIIMNPEAPGLKAPGFTGIVLRTTQGTAKIKASRRLTVKSLAEKTRSLRFGLKKRGIKLGFQMPRPRKNKIPVDASLNTGGGDGLVN